MCYVRLNLFGDDGKTVNQKMAECMWEDVRERIKQLGVGNSILSSLTFAASWIFEISKFMGCASWLWGLGCCGGCGIRLLSYLHT